MRDLTKHDSNNYYTYSTYAIDMAEGEGFEPPVPFPATVVFKTTAIDHSAIPPHRSVA